MRFLFQNHKYGQIIGTLMLLLVLTLFAKLSLDQTQTSGRKKIFSAGNFKRYADKIRNKNKG